MLRWRWVAAIGVLVGFAELAACDLNPQPLPPRDSLASREPEDNNDKEGAEFGDRGGSTAAPSVADSGPTDAGSDSSDASDAD